MNIHGKSILLRAIEREDLPQLNRWANDPETQRMLGGWHFPTSLKDQEKWFASLSCQSTNQRFAVEAHDLGLIGTANLVSIDWKNRNAYQGLMLGDATTRHKGFGIDTLMALMRYSFDELGLARLDTAIIESNTPSLHMHVEKCGWIIEGRKINGYFREGRYWEKVILGITRERYSELVTAADYWRS